MLGSTINTHLSFIGKRLAQAGLQIDRQICVPDIPSEIEATVKESLHRCDLLIITGGLGPTKDDCTRHVISRLLGLKLVHNESLAATISDRFNKYNISMSPSVLSQAQVPEGAKILVNENGTAPGLELAVEGKLVFLLPGPPREMNPMFDRDVIPAIKSRLSRGTPFICRVYRVVGVPESVVEQKVTSALSDISEIEIGYCAQVGQVDVRIITKTLQIAELTDQRVHEALGFKIFGTDEERLEEIVVRALTASANTIAVAESCTGGLIAHRITNVSGSSKVFICGSVTYSNTSKVAQLGVSEGHLQQFGAVSEQVAREMANGIRTRNNATFALSTTGIAGPTGGTPEKPQGLVYIGFATPKKTEVSKHLLPFDRETFKFYVSQIALNKVRLALIGEQIKK